MKLTIKRVGTNPAGPTRVKRFTCFKCASMPSRVVGVRCLGCGLEAEAPLRAEDFTSSGVSGLGRAV